MLLSEKMKLVIKQQLNIQIFGTRSEIEQSGLIPDDSHDGGCYINMPPSVIHTSIANFTMDTTRIAGNDLASTRVLRKKSIRDCGEFSVLAYEVCIGGLVFTVVLDSGGVFNVMVADKHMAEYQLPESS